MSGIFATIFVILSKYIVPAIFVIGIMYFLYGYINYFILGLKQKGRELFLAALSWFAVGIAIQLILLGIGWFVRTVNNVNTDGNGSGGGVWVDLRNSQGVLEVPNTPTRNNTNSN